MQRAFCFKTGFLCVRVDELGNAVDKRVFNTFADSPLAPCEIAFARLLASRALIAFCQIEQAFRCIIAPVEHHVFAGLTQFRINRFVNRELTRIDDAHIHADLNGVIEEHRMHGLAHRLIAAEREGQIGNAAGNMHMRQGFGDLFGRLDEGDAIAIMFFDARCHSKDIGIKHNIFRREASLFGQKLIGAGTDLDLALQRIGLPFGIEGHDHNRSAIGTNLLGIGR